MTNRFITAAGLLCLAFATQPVVAAGFTLSSHELTNGNFPNAQLLSQPYGFGCSGENHSPSFNWSGAPDGTKSFALQIYDRDAPTGLGWVHWQVVNIPASATSLPAGLAANSKGAPSGTLQTRTDFGVPGYGGPCPPEGQTHHYVVTLTALKVATLPGVTADATPALVGFMTKANSLGEATIHITQGR
ncbi:YbhB/YbcL family Raf kinase inhibitor-like protein [Candidatus Pantoea deserta]|uniref:YbhB/YbcL family Raf kinase inhibitor-like protein n=1 Tax=Candidatus Pantoea deserta TaxID=1869313 RepID=A0A3N4NK80_9GAMM|nr:YbhB/YbcL family Raf kinase inhibitor-like protein [Pantoea deserta]RPD95915.1 YbhB/YbcL family Raf kinase inhibitor-like protein [Pantoea deserta]